MSVYVPRQHTGRPQGCEHDIISANVQLWDDEPPTKIVLGNHVYELKKDEGKCLHSKKSII